MSGAVQGGVGPWPSSDPVSPIAAAPPAVPAVDPWAFPGAALETESSSVSGTNSSGKALEWPCLSVRVPQLRGTDARPLVSEATVSSAGRSWAHRDLSLRDGVPLVAGWSPALGAAATGGGDWMPECSGAEAPVRGLQPSPQPGRAQLRRARKLHCDTPSHTTGRAAGAALTFCLGGPRPEAREAGVPGGISVLLLGPAAPDRLSARDPCGLRVSRPSALVFDSLGISEE
ncbi:hypothetical protein J1605_016170 [Eschrichtius robustus]|uniref:Uncharacterized protein n=1 Tax=Eschrichtius robustus TaxID=9764 RepID=A0AB34G7F3_ESCRO|nr:hypothetical protein J1605_016170 [Eschrichtius robustus]